MSEQVSTDFVSDHTLAVWVRRSRECLGEMIQDLDEDQLRIPYRPCVNPFNWELAHDAWFQEKWVLRNLFNCEPLLDRVDEFYDSTQIDHEKRWVKDLHDPEEIRKYNRKVGERVIEFIESRDITDRERYYILYTVFHTDMHAEAFTYMRQSCGYSPPDLSLESEIPPTPGELNEDVEIPGGTVQLGASRNRPFVFDNEKWAHEVEVESFQMARTPVTQGQFRAFLNAGGYQNRALWSDTGWAWRLSTGTERPLYWRRKQDGTWEHRFFDRWRSIDPAWPMMHVSYWEAEAYCNWADRRLPTEAEWLAAARGSTSDEITAVSGHQRTYPWGEASPRPETAALDWYYRKPVGVAALSEGDSPHGCRGMIGNVWEWTSSNFAPFPDFEPDFYQQYSLPWFGSRKVLKGGSWATRSRFIRNGYRNYFTPDRRDVFTGFRTCAKRSE